MSNNDNLDHPEMIPAEGENGAASPEEFSAQDAEKQELEFKSALAALRQEHDEMKDKYLRLVAEFDNYKKRTIRERMDLLNTAAGDTLSALLPVLDDFDRARKIAEDPQTTETFSEGVNLVYLKLYNVLRQRGLEPMDSTGQPFDAEVHEAITEIPAPSPDMQGKVVDTVERGYTLNGKIIRYAKVVVGK